MDGMLKKQNTSCTEEDNIIRGEVEEFDAIIQSARKKLEIQVEPAMPCVTRNRISTAKTLARKVAVREDS